VLNLLTYLRSISRLTLALR